MKAKLKSKFHPLDGCIAVEDDVLQNESLSLGARGLFAYLKTLEVRDLFEELEGKHLVSREIINGGAE